VFYLEKVRGLYTVDHTTKGDVVKKRTALLLPSLNVQWNNAHDGGQTNKIKKQTKLYSPTLISNML
jgi:hypothetical protein